MKNRKLTRSAILAAATSALMLGSFKIHAADVTWDNGASNFEWDLSSNNWTGAAWNNAAKNGAVFDLAGAGPINVNTAVSANSLDIRYANYTTFAGTGSITLGGGVSALGAGVVNVGDVNGTTTISTPIFSSAGLFKLGSGTLVLSAPLTSTGSISMFQGGSTLLTADVNIGDVSTGTIPGGTIKLASASVLPSTTKVGIGYGFLDIGSNDITLKEITFTNHNQSQPWNTTVNATNGVIGTGTLHVTGDINVIGWSTGFPDNYGNTIATKVDLDGKTQMLRIGRGSSFGLNNALMFTNSISNGGIYKTMGYINSAGISGGDGISLYADNTYTGPTVLNQGNSVATGTNATTSVNLVGASFALQGQNGSVLDASLIKVSMGSSLVFDNNASVGTTSVGGPNIPAAFNADRVSDTGLVELRTGTILYRGLASTACTETIGTLDILSGTNTITIVPNNTGGAATLTVGGNMTLAPRATLLVNTQTFGTNNGSNTLGGNAKLKITGTMPTADATGVLPRMSSGTDFLRYDATNGVTPVTSYAADFSTPNTNVAVTTLSTVASSVNINSLKRAGTAAFTTTLGATTTLGIDSGMILNATNTGTLTGGTVAFGAKPGILFATAGMNIASAITGSQGLILASGNGTLTGNLSGLSGDLQINGQSSTLALTTNTFPGAIKVLGGTLVLGTSQTLAGQGDITLGNPGNDVDMLGLLPTLDIAAAGANAVINRNIIVDNVMKTVGGKSIDTFSYQCTLRPLSNSTGSQTLNGNITLNTDINLQGGGGTGATPGATVFTGNISGDGRFVFANGRAIFDTTSNISNAGGMVMGFQGFTMIATFKGTNSSGAPMIIGGGNNNAVNYDGNNSLTSGTITIRNSVGSTNLIINPLSTSTVASKWVLNGDVTFNPGAAVSATLSGPISGSGTLYKTGAGTLVLSDSNSSLTGNTLVTAGTLSLVGSGAVPSPSLILNGSTLNVAGTTTTYSTSAGQTISSGANGGAIVGNFLHDEGTFSPGGVAAPGTFNAIGNFDISGGTIVYTTSPSTVSGNDLINVTGATVVSGNTAVAIDPSKGITSGTYTILTASAGVTGDLSAWTVDNSAYRPGSTGTVAISGNSIVLGLNLATPAALKWSGSSSSVWDVAGTSNWYDSAPNKFYVGDAVTFGDLYDGASPPVTTAVTLNSVVAPSSVTVNSALDYTIAGTGNITGPTSLVKSGPGKLTLLTQNAYSGGTTINAGTINIGGTFTASSSPLGTGTIVLNGGAISGSHSSAGVLAQPIRLDAAGGTLSFDGGSQTQLTGKLYGTGTLNLNVLTTGTTTFFKTFEFSNTDNSGFTGTTVINAFTRANYTNLGAAAPVLTGTGGAVLNGGSLTITFLTTDPKPSVTIVPSLTANSASGFQAGKVRTELAADDSKAIGWSETTTVFTARYTYRGDANLSGTITSTDFNTFVNAANYGKTSGALWAQGDFNYDGKINTVDFNYLAGNFGAPAITAPLPGPGLGAVVPEPASMGLIVAAAGLMLRRRK